MFRIKRTKKLPPPSMVPATVHYAVSVAPAGNITALSADVNKAGTFDAATVAAVKAHYRTRENAGTLTFERAPEPELELECETSTATPAPPVALQVAPSVPQQQTEKGRKAK